MSERRKVGDVVIKKPGAGFTGEQLIIRLVDLEPDSVYSIGDSCFLCDDPKCIEWANAEVLDQNGNVVGDCCHVSECEMEDYSD